MEAGDEDMQLISIKNTNVEDLEAEDEDEGMETGRKRRSRLRSTRPWESWAAMASLRRRNLQHLRAIHNMLRPGMLIALTKSMLDLTNFHSTLLKMIKNMHHKLYYKLRSACVRMTLLLWSKIEGGTKRLGPLGLVADHL
jgi:hypothetical protein